MKGKTTMSIERFIDKYKEKEVETKYSAGIVRENGNDYIIAYNQIGAEKTFSIGQPVYDEERNLIGYLGIGLYRHLDYHTENNIRVPAEYWKICLPTKYCVSGKKVFTYWQNEERKEKNETDL